MNLRNKSYFQFLNTLLCAAFLCAAIILSPVSSVFAQTSFSENPSAILSCRIKTKEIKLEEGEIISNILIVNNPSDKERIFRVEFTRPSGWRRLGSPDRLYTVAPGDSAFVPARLIPSKNSVGSQVIIHALIITDAGQQVAQDYFYAKSEKNVSWLIDAEPGRKVYFKNNELEKDFAASLTNLGAFDQDVFLSMEAIGNGLTIVDTAGNELDKGMTISLEGAGDTTIEMSVNLRPEDRNFKSVSLLTHDPDAYLADRRYSVFLRSTEPLTSDSVGYSANSRVDFVRLPNELRVQEYGSTSLPLAVEAQYQNVLGKQSVMALYLNGLKTIKDEAYLAYYAQFTFRDVYATSVFGSAPWYLGYFDKKWTAEIGNVAGYVIGLNSAGRGIKGSYNIGSGHNVGAFYNRSPYLKNPTNQSFGLHWDWRVAGLGRVTTRYGRSYSSLLNTVTDVESIDINASFAKNHFLGLTQAFSNRKHTADPDSVYNKTGYLVGFNYSSHYLDRKLNFVLGARYSSPDFGTFSLERLSGNSRLAYNFSDKWDAYLSGNYYRYSGTNLFDSILGDISNLEQLIINLVGSTPVQGGSLQPGLYYSISNRYEWDVHARGISMRYSATDFNKNSFSTLNLRAGYNNAKHLPGLKDYFTMNISAMTRVKTWSFSGSYQYGAFSSAALEYQVEQGVTPQMARLSAFNQYLFRNTHFVAENSLFYTYNNQFNSHSMGIYPKMYYFSSTGWRFGAEFGYSLGSNNFSAAFQNYTVPIVLEEQANSGANTNHDITIGANIRKEFGIPIPFANSGVANVPFSVFYDLDGNGQKGKDEPGIENVVLNIDGQEIMTDENGQAVLRNLPHGAYPIDVFPLENLQGWFANVDDSLKIMYSNIEPVPFVRGVKVEGTVFVNRQEIAVADSKPIDMADIRISATTPDGTKIWNTLTSVDGSFAFFLPNGEYIISMNQEILGNRFRLAQNNIPLNLEQGIESFQTSFYITEKERKVNVKKFGTKKKVIKINNSGFIERVDEQESDDADFDTEFDTDFDDEFDSDFDNEFDNEEDPFELEENTDQILEENFDDGQ